MVGFALWCSGVPAMAHGAHISPKANGSGKQSKLLYNSPNFIEQTAYYDHKPRAAWVVVRLLLHRRSPKRGNQKGVTVLYAGWLADY